MNTATCNWTTMRVIDYFWLLLLPLLCLTSQAQALSCRDIVDGSSFEKFEKCTLEAGPLIGNSLKFVRLDFSTTKGDQITNFLAQLVEDQGITPTLSAAFRLVDNKDITQIDFGNIQEWTAKSPPKGEVLIEIANNINLKEFLFKNVPNIEKGSSIKVLIYNNPMLMWSDHEKKIIAGQKTDDSFFETELNACTFQNPLDKTKAIVPTAELMEKCQIFKGDLNLEGSTLKDEITFKDGCLRLVNVDMTKITNITAENGQEQCTVDGVTPEIKNNPGLCGDKMATVAEYAPKAAIQLHKTCTISCKDQATVDHKFYRCSKIDADGISLNQWFTSEHSNVGGQLMGAKGISVKAGGPKVTKISMPALKSVDKLEITDNSDLKILEFPSLQDVKILTIKNNDQLTVNGIRTLPQNLTVGQSVVECNTHEYLVVSDIAHLRHCTKIIGTLVIRNAYDVDSTKFNITEIVGCVKIEGTSLTNLKFLDKAKITCNGQHTLTKNEKLCKPRFLGREKGAKIAATGLKPTGCGKICTSLSEKDCVVFNGNLMVNEKTRPDEIDLLEAINGSLTITGAGPSLEFPVLATIDSPKAPALLISNNPNLASLKMPKIQKIHPQEGQPKVKIENSPKLTDLMQFLPRTIAEACSNPDSTTCQHDMAQRKEETDNMGLIIGLSCGGAFVFLIILGCGIYWCVRNKKENAEAKAKSDAEAALERANSEERRKKHEAELREIQERAETETRAKIEAYAEQARGPLQARIALFLEAKSLCDKVSGDVKKEKAQLEADLKAAKEAKKRRDAEQKREAEAEAIKEAKVIAAEIEAQKLRMIEKRPMPGIEIEESLLQPTFHLIEAIQAAFPATNCIDALTAITSAVTEQERGTTQFRITMRAKKHTKKEYLQKGLTEEDFDAYDLCHNPKYKETVTMIKLNKLLRLLSRDYRHGAFDFFHRLCGYANSVGDSKYKRIQLVHIGTGFKCAIEHIENVKLTLIINSKDGKPYRKVHDIFVRLTTTYYMLEWTDNGKTEEIILELTELLLPENAIGSLHTLIYTPWVAVLYYAWQHGIRIHTDVPDYLMTSYFFFTAFYLMSGSRIGRKWTKEERKEKIRLFPMATMYPEYCRLFGGGKANFDAITPLSIFYALMVQWNRDYAVLETDKLRLKEVVQLFVAADYKISSRLRAGKHDPIQWHQEIRDIARDSWEEQLEYAELRMKYYECFPDPIPGPVKIEHALPYTYIETYSPKLDDLMKKTKPVMVSQGPSQVRERNDEEVEKTQDEEEQRKKQEKEGREVNKK